MGKNQYKKKRSAKQPPRRRQYRYGFKLAAAVIGILMMSIAFVFAHDAITQWGYFETQKIRISGMNRVSAKAIMTQGQLTHQINVLAVNLPLVRKRLVAHPWIAQASVKRVLPNRLEIKVREHLPLAIIDTTPRMLMNTRGEIFKEWAPEDPPNLPLVSGLAWSDLNAEESLLSRKFEAAITVLNMGESQASVMPRSTIKRIDVDPNTGVSVQAFPRIGAVRLGFDQYPIKYERLRELLSYLSASDNNQEIEWIDIQNPDRIVIHPAVTETVKS